MIMRKAIAFVMCIIMCMVMPLSAYADEKAENENEGIKAKSVILMCTDTGKILYKQNEFEHLSPASVTKVMSILLILEALDSGKIALTDKVTASADAVAMGGSQIWLEVGEQMTVEELLKAVVVASANDACTALGEHIAGSSTGFVKMMNDRAKELGLENTNFENCTGLDDTTKNHYSCANDLAVISREVMKYDIVKNYTTIWLDSLRGGKTELNNTNKLVNNYQGITGLKTGTTSNAGFCVSATATRDGMSLVAVVLGSDTSEHRFETAAYLLDYGFANYQLFKPEINKKKIKPVSVKFGEQKSIKPVIKGTCCVTIPKGENNITYDYNIKKQVNAPVKEGDKLGEVVIKNNNEEIEKIDLVASQSIIKLTLKSVFRVVTANI